MPTLALSESWGLSFCGVSENAVTVEDVFAVKPELTGPGEGHAIGAQRLSLHQLDGESECRRPQQRRPPRAATLRGLQPVLIAASVFRKEKLGRALLGHTATLTQACDIPSSPPRWPVYRRLVALPKATRSEAEGRQQRAARP